MVEVDISNIWCSVSLQKLLACEQELAQAHQVLTMGCQGNFLPWLDSESGWRDELHKVEQAAATLSDHSQALVVVGNDSATLGLRALAEQFSAPRKSDLQLFFVGDDFSTTGWLQLMETLEHMDFSIHIISQLGDNLESSLAVRALRWTLTRRYGAEKMRDHVFVTTDKTRGKLRELVTEEGYTAFPMPRTISEHSSVLSPGALFSLAAVGVDLRGLLRGATKAKAEFALRSFENPVWLYAASRIILARRGKTAECLCLTEPEDTLLGQWWRRLSASRNGDMDLMPTTAQCPGDLSDFSTALSKPTVMETLLQFAPSEQKVLVEMDWKDVDGLHALEGFSIGEIHQRALEAVVETAAALDIPLVTISCSQKTPGILGELLYFFELSTALTGTVSGWKPYGARPFVEFQRHLRQSLQK